MILRAHTAPKVAGPRSLGFCKSEAPRPRCNVVLTSSAAKKNISGSNSSVCVYTMGRAKKFSGYEQAPLGFCTCPVPEVSVDVHLLLACFAPLVFGYAPTGHVDILTAVLAFTLPPPRPFTCKKIKIIVNHWCCLSIHCLDEFPSLRPFIHLSLTEVPGT